MPKNADGQTRWLEKHFQACVEKNQDISMIWENKGTKQKCPAPHQGEWGVGRENEREDE